MREVMATLAALAREIPFQRAVDRVLPDLEAVLANGFTFNRLADELAAAGYLLPDGKPPSGGYLGGAVSRARSKVRQGQGRMTPTSTSAAVPPTAPEPAKPEKPPAASAFAAIARAGLQNPTASPERGKRGLEDLINTPREDEKK